MSYQVINSLSSSVTATWTSTATTVTAAAATVASAWRSVWTASVITAAVAAAPVAEAEDNAGSGVKTVVLKEAGAQKLQVIKVIREVTGLGLKEAKDIADAGGNVKEGIPASEAEELKAKLEEAGATVELA